MTLRGLRVIVLAYKHNGKNLIDGDCENMIYDVEANNLILLGIMGLTDKTHPDVKEYIKSCREAGIDVKMITG